MTLRNDGAIETRELQARTVVASDLTTFITVQ